MNFFPWFLGGFAFGSSWDRCGEAFKRNGWKAFLVAVLQALVNYRIAALLPPDLFAYFSFHMKKIRIFGFALLAFFLSACSSTPPGDEPFYTRLYSGTYDEVWLAALRSLNDYPLKLSNKDSGKIQSETVNGPYNDLLFVYPEPLEVPERFRYALKLNFAKLVTEEGLEPLVRVRIIKELERFQDFYTGWTGFPSDGLEEKIVLYRIEHILKMEKALLSAAADDEAK